jgi:beta-lactamase regulating signal transducer with metallopeptidase domain/thiol-disulfide isomerase/thioredoxin
MQSFWEIVASNALLIVGLAVCVGLLGRVWKNPLCLHLLWVLVLLKLVTPPVAIVPIASPTITESPIPESREVTPPPTEPVRLDASREEPAAVVSEPAMSLPAAPFQPETPRHSNGGGDYTSVDFKATLAALPWLAILAGVWSAGIVLFAFGHIYRIVRFRKLLHSSQPPTADVLGMAKNAAKRLGLCGMPEVRMLPLCVSPLVWSLGGRPKVFLPSALFERLDASAQEAIIAHELAHVLRKDHWVRLLEVVITTLFWWHPVVWWAARRLQELEDQCCDAMVVELAPHGAKRYVAALLDTLDFLCERSVAAPLGATAAKSARSMTRRIAMLKNRSFTARWTFSRLMLLLSLAALPMAVAFGQKLQETTQIDSAKSKTSPTYDSRLIGQWYVFDNNSLPDRPNTIISSKDGGKTLQVVGMDESKKTPEPPIDFTTVQVGSQWCMIVDWPTDEHETTLQLVAYKISDDGVLEIRLADDDKIAAAIKAKELKGDVKKSTTRSWLNIFAKGEVVTITDSREAIEKFLKKRGHDCFEKNANPLMKKWREKVSLQRRAVNKLVKDFPEKTDLSTPESAMAASCRSWARGGMVAALESSWMQVDAQMAKEIEANLKNDPNGLKIDFRKLFDNVKIIDVLAYRDDLAVVIFKSSLESANPFGGLPFGRINGVWKSLCFGVPIDDPPRDIEMSCPSVEAVAKRFEGKKDNLWQMFVQIWNEVKKGRTPNYEDWCNGKNLTFENSAGWIWHIEPESAKWATMATRGLVLRLDELKDNRLLLTLAYSEKPAGEVVEFRPVAFDESGKRFEFSDDCGGGAEYVHLNGFTIDLKKIPRKQIEFIGVEKLTKDKLRDVVAPAAFQKLKEARVNALPFPRLGERYNFELTTLDGKKLGSTDLRGKVVLLDFWSTWCGPCMAKMPKLKQTYQRLAGRGFEVVGLNHDRTLEEATRAAAKQQLPWPNVFAPADQRELWFAATGTGPLPRLLLLDRDGIVRADVSPGDLEAEIEKLINKR